MALHCVLGSFVTNNSIACRDLASFTLYFHYYFGMTENDGYENDGPKMTAGREVAGEK